MLDSSREPAQLTKQEQQPVPSTLAFVVHKAHILPRSVSFSLNPIQLDSLSSGSPIHIQPLCHKRLPSSPLAGTLTLWAASLPLPSGFVSPLLALTPFLSLSCSNHNRKTDEYPFPSPIPSPRVAAPPLVSDPGLTPSASDDSDTSAPYTPLDSMSPPMLSRRSTSSTNIANAGGCMQLFIDAPAHPPIPGLASMSPTSPRSAGGADMFAITNALNGLELNGMELPKKVKSKKSKGSLSGSQKRAKIVAPSSWASDAGALGGF
ncbi:hypothetical protein FRC17_008005 [Serendipita sp. 399]|nr:hypothetical protein FRC17_008005 [Serendipita sp. 399]